MKGMPSVTGIVSQIADQLIGFGGAVLIKGIFGKTWGVVNQYGIPILEVDSVLGMTYDAGSSVSNFPVESGEFRSYNKTKNPSMASVQLTKSSGGTLKRGLFLTQLEALQKSTISFHIVTPEYVYMNYQMIGINHSRSASDGATLIKANIDMQEIIEAKINYSTEEVENPADSTAQDGGAKQSSEVSESDLYNIGQKIGIV